ncbi:putative quinol monooxygenase [Flavobacteriaceae bacterium M23B6Z8]
MFIRIVKMKFQADRITDFLSNFNANKDKIRAFEGCSFLELYQAKDTPEIFFTYSYWDSEEALENYRNSELFKTVWKQTKILFAGKPEAWSVDRIESLP